MLHRPAHHQPPPKLSLPPNSVSTLSTALSPTLAVYYFKSPTCFKVPHNTQNILARRLSALPGAPGENVWCTNGSAPTGTRQPTRKRQDSQSVVYNIDSPLEPEEVGTGRECHLAPLTYISRVPAGSMLHHAWPVCETHIINL